MPIGRHPDLSKLVLRSRTLVASSKMMPLSDQSTIEIQGIRIGAGHPCFLIAEADFNHPEDVASFHWPQETVDLINRVLPRPKSIVMFVYASVQFDWRAIL